MSSRAHGAALGVVAGLVALIAGLVSLVVLGYVEVCTVPGLIEQLVFQADPSAGFGLGFLVVAVAFMLIPVDIGVATLIGFWVYIALRRRARV